ncbi:unnamed protein product [Candidula unifasciata]|uniref:Uncharacterized protein n=1 Tax=Candidula unifasciata TaxID=100452 RepID=A0A8S3YWR1_9EUPU|nr:unnamed protein product [Candidula unifasciata]
MLHQCIQVTLVLLVAVLVSTTLTSADNTRSSPGRLHVTECDTIARVSHVCYQCSRRHETEFNYIYFNCCMGDATIREYCDAIYTEAPKRGGLHVR